MTGVLRVPSLLFNLKSHQEEEVFPVSADPDVVAFDKELNLLYVAFESGAVSLFKADNGKLSKLGDANVGPNSHTVAVDSNTHKADFPLKNVNGHPLPPGSPGKPQPNVPQTLRI